jgi:hypothetical protein
MGKGEKERKKGKNSPKLTKVTGREGEAFGFPAHCFWQWGVVSFGR